MKYSFSECLSHPARPLKEHLLSVANIIEKELEHHCPDYPGFREAAIIAGLTHDIGKATYEFQRYIRADENERWKLKSPKTHHSHLSSVVTLAVSHAILTEMGLSEDDMNFWSIASAMAVSRHHGNLANLKAFLNGYIFEFRKDFSPESITMRIPLDGVWKWLEEKFREFKLPDVKLSNNILTTEDALNKIDDWLWDYFKKFQTLEHSLAFLQLYSLLIGADKLDAAFAGKPPKIAKPIPQNVVDDYRRKEFGTPEKEINKLRDEIAQKVQKQIDENSDKKLFTLTAPTGSGKTLTALDVAFKLASKDNAPIIYCLPFTSIIDQNFETIQKLLTKNNIKLTEDILLKHHHLAPVEYKTTDEEEFDTDKQELLVESWRSRLIVTTFVQLFETLFSGRNRALKKLLQIPGAVVLLDEVQAIPRGLWELTREVAKTFANEYKTRFILMTATQPGIFTGADALELLPDSTYFEKLSRTELHLHIDDCITIDKLAKKIAEEYKKSKLSIIAVVNTINDSIDLYKKVKKLLPSSKRLFYLSSNIIPLERKERIKEMKNAKGEWILISTQVIEAGVDISADILHRDFAPLDSIIQAAGRCNREGKKDKGKVHLWKIKRENAKQCSAYMVYDGVLLDAAKDVLKDAQSVIQEPEFVKRVINYFSLLKNRGADNSSLELLKNFEYDCLAKKAKLFKDDYNTNQYFVIMKSDSDAQSLWDRYLEIQGLKDFKERRKKFAEIKADFLARVISVRESVCKKRTKNEIMPIYPEMEGPGSYNEETGYVKGESGGCGIF